MIPLSEVTLTLFSLDVGPEVCSGLSNFIKGVHVFDCRWNLVWLVIRDALDCSSQDLATARLGQPFHEDDSVELGERTDILTHLLLDHLFEIGDFCLTHVLGALALQNNIG